MNNRIGTYNQLSKQLSVQSDDTLTLLIEQAKPLHCGYGGSSALLRVDDAPIFVKKLPLTDLERQPKHFKSTANIFELPLYYQYGVGSTGFGAWRDLAAHIMTTNWVLSDQCANFPILYHWRILPCLPTKNIGKAVEDIDADVQYWDNSSAIRNRLEGIRDASAHLVLFLEYIPSTLSQWLQHQLDIDADEAISFVDNQLVETTDFLNRHSFVHFDAHFNNILTDGNRLYFTDFGLASSAEFELANDELLFLNKHQNYDRCASIASMIHCIVTKFYGQENWHLKLQSLLSDRTKSNDVPPPVASAIEQYGQLALKFRDEFFNSLQTITKSTRYPANEFDALLQTSKRRSKI
ncbi:MAG: phosphotransferase [Candidatus Obscuribacterales bacterium]|nr:phosphotransferase [Candidatus Obscuribacterales bacterium]